MINSSEHCKEIFSNLKRLYLFTAPDNTPGQVTEEDVIRLADCFNKVTKVALIVHVAIESPEPRKGCATQAGVLHLSNGAKFIKTIVVDDPHVHHEDCQSCPTSQQDILALMHRVIDDVDAEWALVSFQGYRWDPCTRPRYTVGVPTRI